MNSLKEQIILVIGIIIINWVLWIRFIKQRDVYVLDEVILTQIKVLCICGLIFLFLVLFLKTLYITFWSKKEKTSLFFNKMLNIPIIKKSIEIIKIYIIDSPKKVYEQIYTWDYFPIQFLGVTVISHLVAKCHYPNTKYPLIKSIVLIEIPKLIVATLFCIDVCYYNQIDLFVNHLWLLIIPIITKIYLYICEHHSKRNIEYFDLYVEIFRYEDEKECYIRYKDTLPNIKNSLNTDKVKIETISNWYYIFCNIRNYIKSIKYTNQEIAPYFNLAIYPLYITSWSYYLYYILIL